MLFRIVQEGIQNALKHSRATVLNVEILITNENLNIVIADNGIGFNTDKNAGMGLSNMAQRTELLRGTIHMDTKPDGGTSLHIIVPKQTQSNDRS